MAAGAAIYNNGQTYGNGIVTIQGSFTDNGSNAVVAHGKGFKVVRGVTAGVYKVTLTANVKGIHSCQAEVNAPASTGDGSFSHPGFAVVGDLQSDSASFFIYSYNFSGTQQWMASTTTLIEFACIASISNLNA